MSSLVARPCLIRAHWPTQLFGLVPQKGMTTLAAPRSLKTSVTSVCHARVDNKLYPCRLGAKIQGQRRPGSPRKPSVRHRRSVFHTHTDHDENRIVLLRAALD